MRVSQRDSGLEEFMDFGGDKVGLFVSEFGIDGQRQDASRDAFRGREVAGFVAKICIHFLEMERLRIINNGWDSRVREEFLEGVARFGQNGVNVKTCDPAASVGGKTGRP